MLSHPPQILIQQRLVNGRFLQRIVQIPTTKVLDKAAERMPHALEVIFPYTTAAATLRIDGNEPLNFVPAQLFGGAPAPLSQPTVQVQYPPQMRPNRVPTEPVIQQPIAEIVQKRSQRRPSQIT